MTKTCFKCGVSKPLSEFHTHSQMADGYLGKCKECTKTDTRRHRRKNPDVAQASDACKHQKHKVKYRPVRDAAQERFRKNNPKKYRANNIVNNALRDGKLIKPKACKEGETE